MSKKTKRQKIENKEIKEIFVINIDYEEAL